VDSRFPYAQFDLRLIDCVTEAFRFCFHVMNSGLKGTHRVGMSEEGCTAWSIPSAGELGSSCLATTLLSSRLAVSAAMPKVSPHMTWTADQIICPLGMSPAISVLASQISTGAYSLRWPIGIVLVTGSVSCIRAR
jgi:hypothetical protein